MAGPKADFVYNSDDGNVYRFRDDRSNGLACGNTIYDVTTNGSLNMLPMGLEPRYVTLSANNPVSGRAPLTRKVVIGNANNVVFIGTTTTVTLEVVASAAGLAFKLSFSKGEERKFQNPLA